MSALMRGLTLPISSPNYVLSNVESGGGGAMGASRPTIAARTPTSAKTPLPAFSNERQGDCSINYARKSSTPQRFSLRAKVAATGLPRISLPHSCGPAKRAFYQVWQGRLGLAARARTPLPHREWSGTDPAKRAFYGRSMRTPRRGVPTEAEGKMVE